MMGHIDLLILEVNDLSVKNENLRKENIWLKKRLDDLKYEGIYGESRFERVFISFAKSGRTWVRLFLLTYSQLMGMDEPALLWSHGDVIFQDFTPKEVRRIILVRNPYDVMVSNYLHQSVRKSQDVGTISDFIRIPSDYFSLSGMNVRFEQWSRYEGEQKVIHYADLFKPIWKEVLEYYKLPIDEVAIAEADEMCQLDNIKANLSRLENLDNAWVYLAREGGVTKVNPDNPDTHKFRRGKIGGYVDYLDRNDIDYITDNFAWESAKKLTERAEEWRHD